ncbi:hypothetical protein [Jeotgalibacillus salarius]|uniref:Uncharacterized protein n=1 Tax=Jeotgalibacillus salarius TaxID=546023 RepID=A0A4Y8LFS2_9BACL|nr:hypothetical protein [Jeotgalibacillus salarius]TFE01486.1 hypothetical protein E2626_07890 [Jeotgalibacillus salarius]
MNSIVKLIEFLNNNTGALTVIVNITLVIVTVIYVVLTGRLSRTSDKTIDHTLNEVHEKRQREETVKKNLIYLINSEIYMNSFIYVFSQYYLLNAKEINLKEKLRHYISSGGATIDRTSKGHIVVHTKFDTWKEINVKCAKYFSNNLMQELTGYYTGVEHAKIYSINGMPSENFVEVCKTQLVSTLKCIELLKEEDPKLRTNLEYDIDGKRLTIDESKGTIIEINKN